MPQRGHALGDHTLADGRRIAVRQATRNFNIEPSGRFMYVCNHRGDAITTFRLTGNGGKVTFTGMYTPVGSPAVIIFHRIG